MEKSVHLGQQAHEVATAPLEHGKGGDAVVVLQRRLVIVAQCQNVRGADQKVIRDTWRVTEYALQCSSANTH